MIEKILLTVMVIGMAGLAFGGVFLLLGYLMTASVMISIGVICAAVFFVLVIYDVWAS